MTVYCGRHGIGGCYGNRPGCWFPQAQDTPPVNTIAYYTPVARQLLDDADHIKAAYARIDHPAHPRTPGLRDTLTGAWRSLRRRIARCIAADPQDHEWWA